jgi:hypothetical protein
MQVSPEIHQQHREETRDIEGELLDGNGMLEVDGKEVQRRDGADSAPEHGARVRVGEEVVGEQQVQ